MNPLRPLILSALDRGTYATPLQVAEAMGPQFPRAWQRVRDELKAMKAEGLVTGTIEGLISEPIARVGE